MKIIHFCIPAPGELIALTDTGELWERSRDPQDFNSGPRHRPKWLWRRMELPDFAAAAATPVHT